MLTADARVETARPSRYLAQICRHINNIYNSDRDLSQATRHQRSNHAAGEGQPSTKPPVHVEWSDVYGTVTSGKFKITMHANSVELTLRAEAADPATLRRIQDLLTGLIDRIGRRDHLALQWQPPREHADQPIDPR